MQWLGGIFSTIYTVKIDAGAEDTDLVDPVFEQALNYLVSLIGPMTSFTLLNRGSIKHKFEWA